MKNFSQKVFCVEQTWVGERLCLNKSFWQGYAEAGVFVETKKKAETSEGTKYKKKQKKNNKTKTKKNNKQTRIHNSGPLGEEK